MKNDSGFTRLELCACLIALSIVVALTLPALATGQSRSHTAQCLNNLRLDGRAVQMWGMSRTDHTPWRTYVSMGGTQPDPGAALKPANAWAEYATLSNELVTPLILACPADTGVKLATEFSSDASHGYLNTGLRASATSYNINIHTLFEVPSRALFTDRNITFYNTITCAFGVSGASQFISTPFLGPTAAWTNAVHGLQGNIVRVDGSAGTATTEGMLSSFYVGDSNGSEHLLKAR